MRIERKYEDEFGATIMLIAAVGEFSVKYVMRPR